MNLRELRNTRQLKAWLKAGQVVELRERDRVLGKIVPDRREAARPSPAEWPDFEARLKRNFGDRMIPIVEDLVADREDRI
jgi:hypothetical protein